METFTNEFISILQYLLPGFLAAWVFYAFTSFPKPSQFERIIQALIFTLITQSLVFIEQNACQKTDGKIFGLWDWSDRCELFFSILTALLLGGIFAYFTNNDKFHAVARKIGITRETSYPSEWFGAFLKNVTYVVLHLNDERRIYGWPIEWPSEPENGHFVLQQASWLEGEKETPMNRVKSIMVSSKDVKWVEFMEKTWEEENGKEGS